jgi:hypothetical protein
VRRAALVLVAAIWLLALSLGIFYFMTKLAEYLRTSL